MNATPPSTDVRQRLDAIIHNESPASVPEMVKAVLIDAHAGGRSRCRRG